MMIEKIKKYDLCIGCGLCASALGKDKCQMELNSKGFYEPKILTPLSKQENKCIGRLCPGINVKTKANSGVWGAMVSICQAWAADKVVRHKAASGGVVTSLCLYLLEHHKVDAVLQVGVKDNSYLHNELHISRTREDVLKNAQSRYAPSLTFYNIKEILDNSDETFALVGKPCDMAAMKNFISEFPQYKERIKYFISIFCAGMPSYNATVKAWMLSGHTDEPVSLKYRGDGWPGNFKAIFKDGSDYQLSYNESWGKILGKELGFRCKICPDGIGMLADVAVGDSWNTKNGYPDFTESEGKCFCMVRNTKGEELMQNALTAGYIEINNLDIDRIKEQQPYQYIRRKLEGWRLLPVQLVTGFIIRFKGLSIWKQAATANYKDGIRNLIGTYRRLKKINGK